MLNLTNNAIQIESLFIAIATVYTCISTSGYSFTQTHSIPILSTSTTRSQLSSPGQQSHQKAKRRNAKLRFEQLLERLSVRIYRSGIRRRGKKRSGHSRSRVLSFPMGIRSLTPCTSTHVFRYHGDGRGRDTTNKSQLTRSIHLPVR